MGIAAASHGLVSAYTRSCMRTSSGNIGYETRFQPESIPHGIG